MRQSEPPVPTVSPRRPGWGPRDVLLRPACLVGVGYAVILVLLLMTHEWDPLFFATLGPQWARHDPAGAKRADGSIFYAMASDPLGTIKTVSAYRMERIFYPMLARAAAGGRPSLIPWAMLLLNWVGIVVGTEIVHRLLSRARAPAWMALIYGAWGGLAAALLRDTAEPVAYAMALLGVWCLLTGRTWLGCAACVCALLSRESVVLLIGPYLLTTGQTRLRRWLPPLVVGVVWIGWLLTVQYLLHPSTGRRPRLKPLWGLLWIRPLDLPLTLIVLVIPAVIVTVLAVRGLWRDSRDPSLWSALLNALLVLSVPPLTAAIFWHSGRVSTGLVAATLLATPLDAFAPRLRRVLLACFAISVLWTLAVVARYLFLDAISLPPR